MSPNALYVLRSDCIIVRESFISAAEMLRGGRKLLHSPTQSSVVYTQHNVRLNYTWELIHYGNE